MKKITLTKDGIAQEINPALDALENLPVCLTENLTTITLEFSVGAPPKHWEKILYPLLGLKIPIESKSLTIYRNGKFALATFEENDQEWISHSNSEDKTEGSIQFRTHNREQFFHPTAECIEIEEAKNLFAEFLRTHKRPQSLRWKKS